MHTDPPTAQVNRALPITRRLALLDVLRAFALLGIYVSIIHAFNGSILYGSAADAGPADLFVGKLESLLINKRFIGLLSLLFGVGIAIQQDNFRRRGVPFTGYFVRRMAVLACLGLINTTFYFNGEILLVYAVLGLLTWMLSRLPAKLLVIFGAFVFLVPAQLFEALVRDDFIAWFRWFPQQYSAERIAEVYLGSDYGAMIRLRWLEYAYIYTDNNFHLAMSWAMILWGYVIGTSGSHLALAVEDPNGPAELGAKPTPGDESASPGKPPARLPGGPQYFAVFIAAAAYTGLFTLFGLASGQTDFIFVYQPVGYLFYAVFLLSSMFTYVFLVALMVRGLGTEHPLVIVLRNNGRLCLTGYMGGALAFSFLFYGYGAGWYGKLSNVELLVAAVGMYLAFTVFATVWLRYFERGPLEWVYRRLSYGKLS